VTAQSAFGGDDGSAAVASPAGPAAPAGEGRTVQPLSRVVYVVAAAAFALLMALSDRYGFHRDELYFIVCARHLQASYVDQPILTPLITRISLGLFGTSLVGLRLWPALAVAGTVVLGGLLAREFGGGRIAQLIGALGVAGSGAVLGSGHLDDTTIYDILAWAGLALVAARVGRTGNTKLWLIGGLVLGLGLANKHSIGFFALALFIGILASGGRKVLLNRWLLAGAVLAALFTIPDLWWQAGHDWATIAMTKRLNQENGGLGNVVPFILNQITVANVGLLWVWIVGLRFLWRSGRPAWRGLAWAWALLLVFFALTAGAKAYYLAGTYTYLIAAGAVSVEGWLTAARKRLVIELIVVGVAALVTIVVTLPVLPVRDINPVRPLDQDPAETVAWPTYTREIASVWHRLPARQRASAVIFTADYGEAGAVDVLGQGMGLPQAVSGHNTLWWWGPGNPHATTVVAVAPGPIDVTNYGGYLRQFFGRVQVAATLNNHLGVTAQEQGGHIYICTQPRHPWGQLWSRLRHYD
jgi:hypothetical protein